MKYLYGSLLGALVGALLCAPPVLLGGVSPSFFWSVLLFALIPFLYWDTSSLGGRRWRTRQLDQEKTQLRNSWPLILVALYCVYFELGPRVPEEQRWMVYVAPPAFLLLFAVGFRSRWRRLQP